MKITSWMGKAPDKAAEPTVADVQDEFTSKIDALRRATGRAERFVYHGCCAVHERHFSIVFERTDPSRRFRINATKTDYSEVCPLRASRGDRPPRRSVAATEIDLSGWRCPHCGSVEYLIECSDCRMVVCGGRVVRRPGQEDVFNCTSSCGASGGMTNSSVVHGVDGARKAAAQLAAPKSPAYLLAGSKALRLKGP